MVHLPGYRVWCTDHRDDTFGVQLMHYEPGCDLPELVRTRPHLAFQVEDLDAALVGRQVLIAPNSPSQGVRVAFVEHEGLPLELLEFENPENPLATR